MVLPIRSTATETEMKEKKARVEDALHATRAAVEEGIVPGGCVALLRVQKALDGIEEGLIEDEQKAGVRILRRVGKEHGAVVGVDAAVRQKITELVTLPRE